jgi:hypothetical protein
MVTATAVLTLQTWPACLTSTYSLTLSKVGGSLLTQKERLGDVLREGTAL